MPPAAIARMSLWSVASWTFFGLTVLATVAMGGDAMLYRSSAGDPLGGPMMRVIAAAGIGAAWNVALICSAIGGLFGLVGVLSSSTRTAGAWSALALNGAFVVVSVVLLLTMSP